MGNVLDNAVSFKPRAFRGSYDLRIHGLGEKFLVFVVPAKFRTTLIMRKYLLHGHDDKDLSTAIQQVWPKSVL